MQGLPVGRFLLAALCAAGSFLSLSAAASAQSSQRATGGFTSSISATATGEELTAQSNLWVFEVSFKPMRMLWVDVTDAKTKKRTRKLIWYLVYKAVNRPLAKREQSDIQPVNTYDKNPIPVFVPEFTLVTRDGDQQKIYADEILPEAQAAIKARERLPLQNSVEIVGEIPQLSVVDGDEQHPIYGVVMWPDVEPETDAFTVFLSGFSSGYRIEKGVEGGPLTLRRTIVLEYWRPGDRFDQNEREIRQRGEPEWIYRADESAETAAQPAEDSDGSDST